MIEFIMGLSPGLFVAAIIMTFIALISQMSLYAKAGQPALSALVPIWNVIVFCKVVGRPTKHSLILIIPGLIIATVIALDWTLIDGLFPVHGPENKLLDGPTSMSQVIVPFSIIGVALIPMGYFVVILFIEVCDSFGKHSTLDKVMCVIFNGGYILFVLGISDAKYEAPWWSKKRGLPYYMPDFKHKGKKYLVTPEGPITGNPADQKVKIEIVDEEVAAQLDAQKASDDHIVSMPAKDDSKTISIKKEEKPLVEKTKPVIKDKPKATVTGKSVTKKEESKSSEKSKQTENNKPKKESASKKSTDDSKKTWREEMADKYKKK